MLPVSFTDYRLIHFVISSSFVACLLLTSACGRYRFDFTLDDTTDAGGILDDAGATPDSGPVGRCGNGVVERANSELCDDANADETDGCLTSCDVSFLAGGEYEYTVPDDVSTLLFSVAGGAGGLATSLAGEVIDVDFNGEPMTSPGAVFSVPLELDPGTRIGIIVATQGASAVPTVGGGGGGGGGGTFVWVAATSELLLVAGGCGGNGANKVYQNRLFLELLEAESLSSVDTSGSAGGIGAEAGGGVSDGGGGGNTTASGGGGGAGWGNASMLSPFAANGGAAMTPGGFGGGGAGGLAGGCGAGLRGGDAASGDSDGGGLHSFSGSSFANTTYTTQLVTDHAWTNLGDGRVVIALP